ncbi:MAG: hypothetical protein PHT54_03585 [Candidatus Nanoarchaeia archaeon]|nr:hypothetical protein [Candidatus Nanoarchaeia archaeon]
MKIANIGTENKIGELIRKSEDDYISGTTLISKYVDFSLYEDINKIDAYLNSKHTSGDTDSLGRDKPFFNIVIAIRNIWFRATDIDRKDIRVKATKMKDIIPAFLTTVLLQNFMRKSNFGQFLNDWGLTLASYGSAIVKFVEKNGELLWKVVSWNKVIIDAIDFDSNPIIEVMELTPSQLRMNENYDQDLVEKLIIAKESRTTLDKQNRDTKDDYIKVYEVHGLFPLSFLTGKENDSSEYVQQMHIVSYLASKEKNTFEDYTLYSGREKQSPYLITHLLKTEGYTLGMGAVKHLFEAQWMANHTMKSIKDYLDLASKLVYQTSDPNFANQNVLSAIETGDILVWNKDLADGRITQIANTTNDITALLNFKNQWEVLAQNISSTPDIMRGENMPSGTAFRQALVIQQESHSNFEIMVENKALYLEEMMRKFIIPYLKKQLNNSDEIVANLDAYGIDKIDKKYIKNESIKRTNQKLIQSVIQRKFPTSEQYEEAFSNEQSNIQEELDNMGSNRFYSPSEINWKEEFKDLEWNLEIEISGESSNKQAILETLSSVFQTIASPAGQMILQTPQGNYIFNKILETAGNISPLEIPANNKPTVPAMMGAGGSPVGFQQPIKQ